MQLTNRKRLYIEINIFTWFGIFEYVKFDHISMFCEIDINSILKNLV